ncbi:MAG: hypothetical protein NC548_22775 [Lachnospiraceae bacterium]|nr:hypothetical protein [Lachnospiraceae bacterium]
MDEPKKKKNIKKDYFNAFLDILDCRIVKPDGSDYNFPEGMTVEDA